MKLTFTGTRGNTEIRTEEHYMHSSLLASYNGRSLMIDCGLDWAGKLDGIRAEAIIITHAHPDHAWGISGSPYPIYATEESWGALQDYEVSDRRIVEPRRAFTVAGLSLEAFELDHSTLAPAVGYRVHAGQVTIFYAPDLVYIRQRSEALAGVKLYVGDGATITRSMVRKREEALIGHTPIGTQLTWCQKEGVPHAIFTHCGSEIIKKGLQAATEEITALAQEREVRAEIAYDGMEIVLR